MKEIVGFFIIVFLAVAWMWMQSDEGTGAKIRATIFAALFFAANYYAITETEIAYGGRGGRYAPDGGGGNIVIVLSVLMFYFNLKARKFFVGSLLFVEALILGCALAVNFLLFAPNGVK